MDDMPADLNLPIFGLTADDTTVRMPMRPVEAMILAAHGYGMMPIGTSVVLMSTN